MAVTTLLVISLHCHYAYGIFASYMKPREGCIYVSWTTLSYMKLTLSSELFTHPTYVHMYVAQGSNWQPNNLRTYAQT